MNEYSYKFKAELQFEQILQMNIHPDNEGKTFVLACQKLSEKNLVESKKNRKTLKQKKIFVFGVKK